MFTNSGTEISNPFSNVAGFPEVVVVFPLNPGSVYVTSNSTNIGGSTLNTFPLKDNTVTIRNRDTMEQVTLKLEEVKEYIEKSLEF